MEWKEKMREKREGKKGREAEREGYRKGGRGERDRKKKRGTRIHREIDQENEVCLIVTTVEHNVPQ